MGSLRAHPIKPRQVPPTKPHYRTWQGFAHPSLRCPPRRSLPGSARQRRSTFKSATCPWPAAYPMIFASATLRQYNQGRTAGRGPAVSFLDLPPCPTAGHMAEVAGAAAQATAADEQQPKAGRQ